jgi:antirestriction protein ArdC
MKGYEAITNEIISKLQQGNIPWRQAWESGLATNLVSNQPYRGINIWLLSNSKYQSNLWLTFNQTKQLGGAVNKGEHGKQIVYWRMLDKLQKDELGEEYLGKIPLMRTYTVFNVQQTNVEIDTETNVFDPIAKAQEIIDGYMDKPPIITGEPSYIPDKDLITIPHPTAFDTPDGYYCTLFHELSHSTGHTIRLNRDIKNHYGSDPYANEEIIAEMAASYLSGIVGVEVYAKVIDNSAAYIQHWCERFAYNVKLIVSLSAQAQKASDWILGNRYLTDNKHNMEV